MEDLNKFRSDTGQGETKKTYGPNKITSSQVAHICKGITCIRELDLFAELNGVKNHLHVIIRRKKLQKSLQKSVSKNILY